MTYARKTLISLQETPYYHVMARCVRRAWLWGFDEYAGRDYSHRKTWVLERLAHLTATFAIDVCAYAVMSDHYHLVLRVDASRAHNWSFEEVVARWGELFTLPPVVDAWKSGGATDSQRRMAEQLIECWRQRLYDVSWFMRCLNEYLARRANTEDGCTGRFWEGRFKSQALLDEAGLLTAMVYVDLNPIRAGIARSPEESTFTSIYERIRALKDLRQRARSARTRVPLLAFKEEAAKNAPALPMSLVDYLALIDWTGRARRDDKPGAIAASLPSILVRLNIDAQAWQEAMRPRGNVFGRALGRLERLRSHARALGQRWIKGVQHAERMYGIA
jgi:REP element-mobilizing transposase RayT